MQKSRKLMQSWGTTLGKQGSLADGEPTLIVKPHLAIFQAQVYSRGSPARSAICARVWSRNRTTSRHEARPPGGGMIGASGAQIVT